MNLLFQIFNLNDLTVNEQGERSFSYALNVNIKYLNFEKVKSKFMTTTIL
jgi:hypothetical protein